MRKIYLLVLLCLFISQVKAQKGVVFKIKYLPNKTYQMSIKMGMKVNANLTGDEQLIEKLKEQGITQPIVADLNLGMAGNMKSGALGADDSFPIAMDYKISNLTVSANGKDAPIPPTISEKDIKIVGHVSKDGIIVVDSAAGKKANDTTQKKMQQMMNLIYRQIKFPDKAIKPGDSFTQGMPLNIPVKGSQNVKVEFAVIYKLVSISDGKAYFDTTPNFSMNLNMQKVSVDITGTGAGKMVYSIKDNYPISSESKFDMKLKVTAGKVNVDGTATINSSINTVIN